MQTNQIQMNQNLESNHLVTHELLLAQPRGFCAGVDRAITIVEQALIKFGAPIYVRHEIVHNKYVVESLKAKGVVFIKHLDEVPEYATLIFSAHGVSKAIKEEAKRRALNLFDATCPLVTKVHVEVAKMAKEGMHILMIGHKGHPEVAGTIGQLESHQITLIESLQDIEQLTFPLNTPLAYVTQTTLSVDETQSMIQALKQKYPHIDEPKKQDICYATQNRQDAVKFLAPKVDLVIVVGSQNSSNSQRLLEVALNKGKKAYLIDDVNSVQADWFVNCKKIGITAGASAPEELAQSIIAKIQTMVNCKIVQLEGIEENMHFPLPKGLS